MNIRIQWFNNPPDPCWDEPDRDESDALWYLDPPKLTREELHKMSEKAVAAFLAKKQKENP